MNRILDISWRTWAAALACAAVALTLGVASVKADRATPFDEHTHFDYVVKLAKDGRLPAQNELLGQEALWTFSCDPPPGWTLPCKGPTWPYDVWKAPFTGMSYVTTYPPTYYALTALPTATIHALRPSISWVVAARYAQVLWLVALSLLVFGTLALLGASRISAALGSLLVSGMPLVLLQTSHVNNDGLALAATVLPIFLWLFLRGHGTRWRLGLSLIACLVALTVKETAFIALPTVAAFEALLASGPWLARLRRALIGSAGVLTGYAVFVYVLDPLVRGTVEPLPLLQQSLQDLEPAAVDFVGLALVGGLRAFADPTTPLNAPLFEAVALAVAAWAIGGCAFAAARVDWRGRLAPVDVLRPAALAGVFVVPLLLGVQLTLTGNPLWFNPRYVAPALVLAVLGVIVGMRRGAVLILLALTVAFLGYELATIVGS